MKYLIAGCALVFLSTVAALAAPLLRPNDRLAVCGDAMTGDGGYSIYLEDYLLMCQPVEGLEVAQFGWGGQTAGDFLARLETDLLPYKPTVVLTCFGMNDGAYRALETATAERYRTAQTELVQALKQRGVRTIVIGSPKCVDSFYYHKDPAQAAVYNKTLGALAAIAQEVAQQQGVGYADVFGATLAAMTRVKAKYGEDYAFDGESGNQPSDGCKLTMAYAFLKALGYTEPLGTLTVDFAAGTATGSPGQKIVSFQDRKLTIESLNHPFHFPGYPSGQTDDDPLLRCMPFNDEVNRYVLVVKNLPTAQTKLYWGGDEQYDFSSAELAKGVNLTGFMLGRVFGGPGEGVDNAVRNQQQQERIAGSALLRGAPDPEAETKRAAALQVARSRVLPIQHAMTFQPLAPPYPQPRGPIPVIVDTDMNSDVDDVGAVALLNTFMNQGQATLLACVANTHDESRSTGPTLQAINTYYGHPAIPIGTYHGEAGPATPMASILPPAPEGAYHGPARVSGSHYTLKVRQRFAPDFPDDDHLPAGVDVYRRALASAADGSVVIVSIGLLENLQDLVQSQPDAISKLSGLELVRKKVRQLVVMANTVPQDAYVVSKWPTKIVWTTFIGTTLSTGRSLISTPENNPVRVAYALFGDEKHNALLDGRQSWDLTAAWLAVRGPGELWDVISGTWRVDPPGGYGTWIESLDTSQLLAITKMPNAEVVKRLEAELSRPPQPDAATGGSG
ncbi:MAG TPA: GDSL-type esterase/lipase family protein [Armatimonadota bacterium]|jgi:lysophospholipase L1-like esterase